MAAAGRRRRRGLSGGGCAHLLGATHALARRLQLVLQLLILQPQLAGLLIELDVADLDGGRVGVRVGAAARSEVAHVCLRPVCRS